LEQFNILLKKYIGLIIIFESQGAVQIPDKLFIKMKFSIIIAEQNILTQSDVKIWMDIGIKLE
jgi:hypothetical protein